MIKFSQRIKAERQRKGLTIEEIAKSTKIRASFLTAIEKGEYGALPSSTYAQGFVRNYIEYLGLPQKENMALFKREFSEREMMRVLPSGLPKATDIPITRIRLSYAFMAGFISLLLLFSFILYQYRFAFLRPPLELSTPYEGETVDQIVTVKGKTDPNVTVLVNDIPVALDPNGSFSKQVSLFLGKGIIRVVVKSKFGKETSVERHVQVVTDTK